MKIHYLILLIFLVHNSISTAQSDARISRKDFKAGRPGFSVAWQHIMDGDEFYMKGGVWYTKALKEYMQAYKYNGTNAILNYKIGVSLLFSDNKDKAYEYLLKAYQTDSDVTEDVLLLSGLALQFNGKYTDASDKINLYLSSEGKKPEKAVIMANKCLEECKSAIEVSKDTLSIEIKNVGGSINSDADDYSVVLSSDGRRLFFASRKPLNPDAKNYYDDTKFDENIFVSLNTDGNWSVALLVSNNLMTNLCETPLFLDNTDEVLYIYVGYEGGGDVKYSEFKKGVWKNPRSEPYGINTSAPETSFCINSSGDEIVFISDRGQEGLGGKDVYFIKKEEKKWSKPVNAGESINTKFNEESVRYSGNGDTLWFSSEGHNTIGGYDIFYSKRNGSEGWSPAVNAGLPVNTPWDELFFVPSPADSRVFFFVSNRSGGFGGLDIYTGRILPLPR